MTRNALRLPLVLFVAGTWISACVIPPKSSGELETADGSGTDDAGDDETDGDDIDGDGTGTGIDPDPMTPGPCEGDCAVPPPNQWSRVVPTDSGATWACDVEIDPLGRVALAWRIDPDAEYPGGRAGIDLMSPDGTLLDSVAVEGQTFSSIAFASDGTLRARGATAQPGGGYLQGVMALDDTLATTWSMDYAEVSGAGQCDWGWSGAVIDANDYVVTYDYVCGDGSCPQSIIRRHRPDGSIAWQINPGGNPSLFDTPIAVGADGSVFHGQGWFWDSGTEVEIFKYSADGTVLWSELIPHELERMWTTPYGGVYAQTRDFGGNTLLHRLEADGTLSWSSDLMIPDAVAFGSAANGSGFFVQDGMQLHRTSPSFVNIWSAPIDHSDGWFSIEAVSDDERTFAFASSNTGGDTNYWVTVLRWP